MMNPNLPLLLRQAGLIALWLAFVTGCAPTPAAPTTAPTIPSTQTAPAVTATEAPSPSPTLAPTKTMLPTPTPTAMPAMPQGPFTWSGSKRPLLMAHYMPWYQSASGSGKWGWHWTMDHFSPKQNPDGSWTGLASHFTPQIGPYDSSDPTVLEYQVNLMKLSGIDGVIVDWYGSEDFWDYGIINDATGQLFRAVQKAGLKFAICYEDQTMKNMVANNHFQAADALPQGQKAMAYLQKTWFTQDAYLKVNGQPVLFTFGPAFFMNGSDWKTLFSGLNPKPLFITLDNHSVPDVETASFPWPPMWASVGGVLSHDVLLSYLNDFYDKAKSWKYTIGAAFPGFYDIYKEANVSAGYGFLDALDGKTFRFTLQNALDHSPDVIQLITWNDYGEGTNIEPTVEYGNKYLEMVQEARTVTSAGKFTFTAKDLDLPYQIYTLRQKYSQDLAVSSALDKATAAILAGDPAGAAKILASVPAK